MNIRVLYKFGAGQLVPRWLYSVHDLDTEVVVECRFGTAGRLALLDHGVFVIWPSRDRAESDYLFTLENGYLSNGWAGHPAGEQMLQVLPSEDAARSVYGDAIDGPSNILTDDAPSR